MKKLCFIATTPFVINPFLLGHLGCLAEGYDVTLCANLGLYPLSLDIDPRVKVIDVPIVRKVDPIQDIKTLWALIDIFRKHEFDSVHSIMPKAGLLGMLASYFCRVPHRVHTFTGQVWATKTGWKRSVMKLLDRLIILCATRVFSDSESQSRFLEQELSLAKPVRVMGKGSISGVNMTRFRPNAENREKMRIELEVPESHFVFLFVGRVARDKGVSDMVTAFSRLFEERQDISLWVVGPDEEGLTRGLKIAAGDAGQAVRWIGASSVPETYMAAADLLLLPSYREGFGLVIVEAASCETPALAYKIDGVVDAIVQEKTGVLVPLRDLDALTAKMRDLVANPRWVAALGQAARHRVETDFTAQMISSAWINYYDTHVKLQTLR